MLASMVANADNDMSETYTITDLAQEFGVTTRTIRFYEDKQLLAPERRGRTRIYTRRDRTRLKLVLRGKRLGFSLDEVRDIIELYDGTKHGETEQLVLMCNKLKQSREALIAQRDEIDLALEEMDEIERSCIAKLQAAGIQPIKN